MTPCWHCAARVWRAGAGGLFLSAITAFAATRTPWTTSRVVGSPNPPAPYAVERVCPEVKFQNPVELAFAPRSRRLFVAEQGGKLWSFDTRSNSPQPDLVIDLRKLHQPFDNFLAFAFHPGFATNRFVFINYNEPPGRAHGAYVSRFTLHVSTPATLDPASERIVIRWLSGGHNGCTLAFGNDGHLYISTGDADDPDPPDGKRKTGQDLSDLLASVLRIDVDGATGTNAYVIPPDNPFLNTPGARPEIWAFGFRNPWRMSFDHATGDLWLGDVGWEQWEMIHRVQRGGNYGWPLTEGPNLRVRTDVSPGPGPILPALHAIPHSEGASITGGHVYRGSRLPALRGAYLYGDWETGKFWALRQDAGRLISNEELCDTALKPISFALDPDGELLILDYNGGLYRLVPNPAPVASAEFPRRLGDTGLFTSLHPLIAAPGVVAYRPAAPMWNDHAQAEWWIGVPGVDAIATAGGVGNIAGGTWFFPSNTVLARTLTLAMESGKPASRRPIETQLLHWDGQAWNPYSYRWRADAAEADLVPAAGTNDSFTVTDNSAPGGRRETPWRFHSRAECLRCHNAWAGDALTLNWLQLDAPSLGCSDGDDPSHVTSAATEMDRLARLGVVKPRNPPRNSRPLVDPYDAAQPLADRARSWLHVNCAACHRSGAGGAVALHLNFDKPLKDLRLVDERPTRGDFGLADARVIAPGEPFRSTLFYRVCTEGAGHMPHLGARLADEEGVQLVEQWIRSLPRKITGESTNVAPLDVLLERAQGSGRRAALTELMGSMNGALALFGESAGVSLRAEAAKAAALHTNVLVRDLFQRFLPPAQRRRTLGDNFDPATVLALRGNAARGRELFFAAAQCATCHAHGGTGRAFGPDLSPALRNKTRIQLLDDLVRPSASITPEYRTVIVTQKDDSEVAGFITRREPDAIFLRDATLAERRIALGEIREQRESTLSAMPEGLLAPLTAQEAADLIEFLSVAPTRR